MVLLGMFPFTVSVLFLQSLRFTDAWISARFLLLRVHLSWYPVFCHCLWCLTSHLAAIEMTVRTWLHSIPYGVGRWGLSSNCFCADVFSNFKKWKREKDRKSELFSRTFLQLSMRRQWIPNAQNMLICFCKIPLVTEKGHTLFRSYFVFFFSFENFLCLSAFLGERKAGEV